MLTADRPEFERQASLMCAAFTVRVGDFAEAYWVAFNKLSLIEFTRMVEHVIGPEGPDRMPTTKQLWAIRKKLAKAGQSPGVRGTQDVLTAIVESALARFSLTEKQIRMAWNWIGRDVDGPDCAILGVIIPQDPDDPVRYPAHRLMVSDLEQKRATGG